MQHRVWVGGVHSLQKKKTAMDMDIYILCVFLRGGREEGGGAFVMIQCDCKVCCVHISTFDML